MTGHLDVHSAAEATRQQPGDVLLGSALGVLQIVCESDAKTCHLRHEHVDDARVLARLTQWLDSGRKEALGFARTLDLVTFPVADADSVRAFTNVNVPEDLGVSF